MQQQIEILFKGLRRKVSEKQYSKIRHFPYQTSTSRVTNKTVLVKDENIPLEQLAEDLQTDIEQIQKSIIELEQQNKKMMNTLKKQEKIKRICPKSYQVENKIVSNKLLGKYQQFLLSLKVIDLEQVLDISTKNLNDISEKSKKGLFMQKHFENKVISISKFIRCINLQKQGKFGKQIKYIGEINKKLIEQTQKIKLQQRDLNDKLKILDKQNKGIQKCISEIDYQLKQCSTELKNIQNKKKHKDPYQFISTKGGQMKNVCQLQCQIQQLKQQNNKKQNQIQERMQKIIVQKIRLRNQIQKYQTSQFYYTDYMQSTQKC